VAEIVLFHHVQGLTLGIKGFGDELRAAGHTVHTPDLFDGRTFPTLEEGMAFARTVGFDAILDRGVGAAEALGTDMVYAGFSMGVMPAQKLAQTRAGARGALLIDACIPVAEFGERWPAGVPFQVHGMDADPEFVGGGDRDAAQALVDSTQEGALFLYPGDVHLFADSSLPSYDQHATELMTGRILDFLSARES
jgi:dienelactone hydrolase